MRDEQPPVEITVYENGPVVVRGAYRLQNRDRKEIDPGRETIALCRCGLSALKPFCDGNHALRGAARSELRADPEGGFPLKQVRAPKLSITNPFATPSQRRPHERLFAAVTPAYDTSASGTRPPAADPPPESSSGGMSIAHLAWLEWVDRAFGRLPARLQQPPGPG